MFIRTDKMSEFINSEDIVRLRAGPKNSMGVETSIAILRDGTAVALGCQGIDEVAAQVAPVISAAPGYEALWTVQYDDDPVLAVIRHPVLGWRVDLYGCLMPVTLEDHEYVSNIAFSGVRYPDGQVIVPNETRYENEEKWFEDMQKYALERKAGKAVA